MVKVTFFKNLLLVTALTFSVTSYADVLPIPPALLKVTGEKMIPAEKSYLYQKYLIVKTQDAVSQIGSTFYSGGATLEYLNNSGALAALVLQKQASDLYYFRKKVEFVSLFGGLALGVLGATVYEQSTRADQHSRGTAFSASVNGLAIGGLAGELFGLSIFHWSYKPKAEAKFEKAKDAFNQHFESRLQMEGGPNLSGISGTIKLNYANVLSIFR